MIRRANAADAAALAELRFEFRSALGATNESRADFITRCADWMRAHLRDREDWMSWIAVQGDAVVGAVWLHVIEKIPNPVDEPEAHGYVTSLYVQPAARAQGIGSALLEAALAECSARAVDSVILWPTPESRTLYERYGFSVGRDLMHRRGAG